MKKIRLIILALVISSLLTGCYFLPPTPNSVKIENPTKLVADANKLIEKFKTMPAEEKKGRLTKSGHIILEDEEIPESMKFKELNYVCVTEDRVNLVLWRNPDIAIGIRVWSSHTQRQHKDKPTKYPNIYWFLHDNDVPVSPSNIF